MSQTESIMVPLGTKAPDFSLPEPLTGKTHRLKTLTQDPNNKATVIIFMCNHCPFVKHILNALIDTANEYQSKGVTFIGINSNDSQAYPEDAPEKMRHLAETKHLPFVYLFDETQDIAKAYRASCTPDFFIYNLNLELAYRGQFDSTRPSSKTPPTGADLKATLDCLIANKPVHAEQHPSIGCNIKWVG